MPNRGNRLQVFWQEFVRRRVVRVAVIYGAGAWVGVQVADVGLEAFELEFLLKYIVAAALLGFPLALVLSWMFDITPGGIQRTAPIGAGDESRRSIAVLPFANFSDDPGNEYFSDGLAEEIRDQLARVPGLRVAARTSSFAFKGKNEDVREIGRQLDVGLILEGGVRKHESTLRISAELVDTRKGYQLWSATFERQLQDVFSLQSEISRSILDAVHLKVLEDGLVPAPTTDIEAYNLYLLGRHHFHKRTEGALGRAVDCFTRAIDRDPDFALAHSGFADAVSLLNAGFYGNLPAPESISRALPAARRALELAPESAEAHASLGLIRHIDNDAEGAMRAFDRAIALNPSYLMAHVWRGVLLTSHGRFREAAEANRRALRLDPLSPIVNTNAGFDAVRFGDDKVAEKYFLHAIEIDPDFPVPYSGMARLRALRGVLDDAFRWIDHAVDRAPTRAYYLARKGFLYLQLGEAGHAQDWFDAARAHAPINVESGDFSLALDIIANEPDRLQEAAGDSAPYDVPQRALAAWLTGDKTRALAYYRERCPDMDKLLLDIINDDWVWCFAHPLNHAHLRLQQGDSAAAADVSKVLDRLERIWRDDVVHPETHYLAASAHAILGRRDEAARCLTAAADSGWRNLWWGRRDPNLASIADDPRVGEIYEHVAKQIRKLAERVQRVDT